MQDEQKKLIFALIENLGAARCGAVGADAVRPFMSPRGLARLEKDLPGAKSIIVAAFSYFAGGKGAGSGGGALIARYARGEDYHRVVGEKLAEACGTLSEKFGNNRFVYYVDDSPLPEVAAARLSGVGVTGGNGLCIVPEYGSYVFIGCVATDLILPAGKDAGRCSMCGMCALACPTGALNLRDGKRSFDRESCLSHISQKKGKLSTGELEKMREYSIVWGCDRCLDACPENTGAKLSAIPQFRENLMLCLEGRELSGLDGESFSRAFGNRAFAWRGAEVLKRNAENIENSEKREASSRKV